MNKHTITLPNWQAIAASTVKPHNDYFEHTDQAGVWRSCEDRFVLTDNAMAVSDGAGGVGLYCGAWAEMLVNNLPNKALHSSNEIDKWIGTFWKKFQLAGKELAGDDFTKYSKFVQEGSFATLSGIWLSERETEEEEEEEEEEKVIDLEWLVYGDSPFLLFDEDDNLITTSHSSLTELEQDPYLLNWKDLADGSKVKADKLEISKKTTVVLASDAIGEFVLFRNLLTNSQQHPLLEELLQLAETGIGRVAELARKHTHHRSYQYGDKLEDLVEILNNQESFEDFVQTQYKKNLLANDDSTLVIIQFFKNGREEDDISNNQ